ncbi:hypothetical protein [Streptomyces sp. N35]|uniref:hypothetical protein n=1 Tax=Streptomyces sp. N35 TaxID=2795730 RepID=UPI0018F5568D|nr:hypothetical protein [Streptomyces sp. N35]
MRRLIVLGSAKGAPGVTTTALALAASWPSGVDGGVRPVMVEADAQGGALAVRFGRSYTPGLLDVAAAARRPQPGSLLGAVQELPFGVRVVVAPVGPVACAEAVRMLGKGTAALVGCGSDGARGTVLVDVGDFGEDTEDLVAEAERLVLVTRGGADELAHVFARCELLGAAASKALLVVVGPCSYSEQDIVAAVGVGEVCFLPWDVRTAEVLAGRAQAQNPLRTHGRLAPRLLRAAGGASRRLLGEGQVDSPPAGLERDLASSRAAVLPSLTRGALDVGEGGR